MLFQSIMRKMLPAGYRKLEIKRLPFTFRFSIASRPALGPTQSPTEWVPVALSPGVKRPGREANHSPLPSAEVKNVFSCISTPPHVFMA
jgi:hypothetical protein